MTDRERLANWSEEQARRCRALYGPQTVGAEWARNHEAIAALLRKQTDELRQRILVQSGMAGGDLAVLPMVAKVLIGDVPQKAAETEPTISEPEGEEVAAFTAQDMARWLEEKANLGEDDHWHSEDCPTCARYQRAAALLQRG